MGNRSVHHEPRGVRRLRTRDEFAADAVMVSTVRTPIGKTQRGALDIAEGADMAAPRFDATFDYQTDDTLALQKVPRFPTCLISYYCAPTQHRRRTSSTLPPATGLCGVPILFR